MPRERHLLLFFQLLAIASVCQAQETIRRSPNHLPQPFLTKRSISPLQIDPMFLLQQAIDLSGIGVTSTFTSLQLQTIDDKSMISVVSGNKAYTFICNQDMANCTQGTVIEAPKNVQLFASALSDNKNIMVLGGSTQKLYVFERSIVNSSLYVAVGELNDSTGTITKIKMTPGGAFLIAGGTDRIPRVYSFNQSSPSRYTLFQNLLPMLEYEVTGIQTLNVTGRNNYIFIASDNRVNVYIQNSTGKYEQKYILGDPSDPPLVVITVPPKVTSQLVGVLATGGNSGIVRIYQYMSSDDKLSLVQNISNLNNVISLAFSEDSQFLVVGNHNSETYIYKKNKYENNTFFYTLFETIIFSNERSNFAKVARFKTDGTALVMGSDDFFLRIYRQGVCNSEQTFEYGRCQTKSYIWIYIVIAIGVIVLIIVVVIIYKKKVRIPQENQNRISADSQHFQTSSNRDTADFGRRKKPEGKSNRIEKNLVKKLLDQK